MCKAKLLNCELDESELKGLDSGVIESLFSVGNGYVGTRGTRFIGEALSNYDEGTYLNGAFHREPITYGESAFGFATHNNILLQVANGKRVIFKYQGKVFKPIVHLDSLNADSLNAGSLKLNLSHAFQYEETYLETNCGKRLRVTGQLFISQKDKHLMAIQYKVTALNFSAEVTAHSMLEISKDKLQKGDDPREGSISSLAFLKNTSHHISEDFSYLNHRIDDPLSTLCVACTHEVDGNAFFSKVEYVQQDKIEVCYLLDCRQNNSVKLNKFLHYEYAEFSEGDALSASSELISLTETALKKYVQKGWKKLYSEHCFLMQKFWKNSDISIDTDSSDSNVTDQVALRLNLLHLHMSAGNDGLRNIAAKGLTGMGYDGHYFWDSEIYILPFFIYNAPQKAKQLLMFRYNTLPQARDRANQMSIASGALFPWRTIGGEECSAFFLAGTAQYHINAAISYAVRQYLIATNDWEFMFSYGAELIFETVRLWPSIGHFNYNKQGQYCIDQVTGPDEYTALVNNNFYTNSMAKLHLEFAFEIAEKMAQVEPDLFEKLSKKIKLKPEETKQWDVIAKKMYLPYDELRNINPQDDHFLDKKAWDFDCVPADKYPLLLHFHPLVIYRHQVLKQADVVLAMVLLDNRINPQTKKSNLEFYEPLTTHDSTLSACAHCIAYCEVGDYETAYKYYQETLFVDLNNLHNNSHYGIHTASMGGAWLCVVQGFAGMRVRTEGVFFSPHLPSNCSRLAFKIQYHSNQLEIVITRSQVSYRLVVGKKMALFHHGKALHLSDTKRNVAVNFSKIGL